MYANETSCQKPVRWSAEAVYRPFCSERCRLIDLGEVGRLGLEVDAHADPDPREGPLPLEPLPDPVEEGHMSPGPGDLPLPARREPRIADLALHLHHRCTLAGSRSASTNLILLAMISSITSVVPAPIFHNRISR
ncbi:TPA: DNA gyrase inhibitor YacG [Candidatus Bipolaricaulota bacterium]|nr:DNA gyrase inhibitor YacG [Candidatus Bipolaricaulota bacterium]